MSPGCVLQLHGKTFDIRRIPQIEHPKNVHLLRGNHEAADINALFGFRMECVERLGALMFFAAVI